MTEKYAIQENQYEFPYHYLAYFDKKGVAQRHRALLWGYKYLCYLEYINEVIHDTKPQSVLDIGCGEGKLLNTLRNIKAKKIGVDTSERAIAYAKAFADDASFIATDAKKLNERFDVVVAMEVLEHIPDSEVSQFLQTISERLSDGGTAIVSVPTVAQPLQAKHYRHYTKELFTTQLNQANAGLEIQNTKYLYNPSLLLKLYYKLTSNRFWYLDVQLFNRLMWRHIKKHVRDAEATNGHSVVFTLKKK